MSPQLHATGAEIFACLIIANLAEAVCAPSHSAAAKKREWSTGLARPATPQRLAITALMRPANAPGVRSRTIGHTFANTALTGEEYPHGGRHSDCQYCRAWPVP